MTDYIGKYVKPFESGSVGSLALSSCGADWGLSAGSYQLTLRWGNCINFLKKYFPSEATSLFFNSSMKDIASKTWPGNQYCSSPDAVKSVWQKCYNKVGAENFFEYEHAFIESMYYTPIKNKIKSILDLDTCKERAFQECFWSWAVHRGSGGAYNEFKEVLNENHITSLEYVNKETLFDLIYDKRLSKVNINRYKKGLPSGSSERETLRPLLGKGTFSGKQAPTPTVEAVTPKVEEKAPEFKWSVTPISGTVKVILRNDVLNIRKAPIIENNIVRTVSYGAILTVKGKVYGRDFYELNDGTYVSSNTKYVQFTETKAPSYTVRVKAGKTEIHTMPDATSKVVGSITQNGVYTIVQEQNGFGKLKSGAGWISLNSNLVTRLT